MEEGKRIIALLQKEFNPVVREGMLRYGIPIENALGIPMPFLRNFAKSYKNQHELSIYLWASKIQEAQILATLIADPKKVTNALMDDWANDFNSWELCDQCCSNLFDKSDFVIPKIYEWSLHKKEFVKRAAFVLIACTAVHDKKKKDEDFIPFFALIKEQCCDDRLYVKKAVNWALRQLGKRSKILHEQAMLTITEIRKYGNSTSQWIASDAYRELSSEKINKRLKTKPNK